MYRRSILLLLVSALSVGVMFAHGHEKHVMGTVKAIGGNTISVMTTAHQVQTVQITAQTKFVRGGSPSTIEELKVGDRVVIHAKPEGAKLEATEVRSGMQPRSAAMKK